MKDTEKLSKVQPNLNPKAYAPPSNYTFVVITMQPPDLPWRLSCVILFTDVGVSRQPFDVAQVRPRGGHRLLTHLQSKAYLSQ